LKKKKKTSSSSSFTKKSCSLKKIKKLKKFEDFSISKNNIICAEATSIVQQLVPIIAHLYHGGT
jgi:hypothetical protein